MSPVIFEWDGDHMVPLKRFHNLCNSQYTVGETYRLEVIEERSQVTHNHFFACIQEAWLNLPDHMAEQFPTANHLRKWALIRTGYHDERSIVAASKAEAQRLAAFIKPMDDYAVVLVKEAVVSVYTAKSQSKRAMGKEDFQRSKQAVLDLLSSMLGVERKALEAQSA